MAKSRIDVVSNNAGLAMAQNHNLYNLNVTLFVGKPPLKRAFGPVEVKGFEPSASALRMKHSTAYRSGG